ncbi:MAG: ABC transporter permease [Sporolactobacillus sp.]
MSNFFGLLQNENMKIYRRGSFKVMMIILVGLVILVGAIIRFNSTQTNASVDAQWKQQYRLQVAQDKKQLAALKASGDTQDYESTKKDMMLRQYRLDHNLQPPVTETLWSFVMGVADNMITVIGVLTVIVVATSIASEFDSGTIKLLLIRPIYRTEILLSKYVAALVFTLLSLVVLFLTSWLVGGLFFGFDGATEAHLIYAHGAVHQTSWLLAVWQTYLLGCVSLVMTVTAAGLIAAVFRNGGLAIGLSIFMMMAGPIVVQLLAGYDWVKYVLFANTDLTQYMGGTPLRSEMTLGFSLAVLAAYYIVFVLVAWAFFTRRDIKA